MSKSGSVAPKFGTDGWRGVIADDFTEANAALVVQGVAGAWRAEPGAAGRPVVVGYDTRFNSRIVAHLAADILAAAGWPVLLADRPVPTPTVSFAVADVGAVGGLVITASHNPARFNGIKIKGPFGGSAPPEFTARVEAALGRTAPPEAETSGAIGRRGRDKEDFWPPARVETVDLLPRYLARLRERLAGDRRPARPLTIVADALHGATNGLLRDVVPPGWGQVRLLHETPDPRFGGLHPEPIPPHVDGLVAEVRRLGADVGVALDGDGDRLGVVTGRGRYLTPNAVLALLIRHLVAGRGWRGEVVKNFAMGAQIDRVCQRLGLPLHVTPIGFKHITSLMRTRDILIGGEESGGIGFRDHLPERDGLLSALLVLEAVVASGTTLDELIMSLETEAGTAAYRRRDYTLDPDRGRRLVARLDAAPPDALGARTVTRREALDGRKYWLASGAWVLVRPSGTEPVLRVYVEAPTMEEVDELHAAAEGLVARLADA